MPSSLASSFCVACMLAELETQSPHAALRAVKAQQKAAAELEARKQELENRRKALESLDAEAAAKDKEYQAVCDGIADSLGFSFMLLLYQQAQS